MWDFFWHSWTSFCNWDMLANKLFNIFWLPCGEVRHAANLKSRAQETDSMRRLKQKRRIICQWQKMTIKFGQLLTIYILFDVFSCTHVRTMMDICFWSCIEFLALSCASLPIHAHASGTQVCFWCCSHSTGSHSTEVLPKLRSWFAKICKELQRFKDFLTHFIVSIAFFKFRMLKFSIGKYLQSCRRWGCSEMQRETWRHGLGQQIEPLACQVPLKHCVRFKHWAQLLLPVASACMYQVHNRLVEGRRQHSWLLARGHHVAC